MPNHPARHASPIPAKEGFQGWRGWDGRWVTAIIVVAYFILLATVASSLRVEVDVIWNWWGVPALPQPFQDLRDIATGIETFEKAENPWSSETIAASVAAFSYPKWWLSAAFLGLNLETFHVFGYLIAILYFACALFVLGKIGVREGVIAGVILISPTVMTGVERGNCDLLIFAVLALAMRLRQSIPYSALLITWAGFLKIYPTVALLAVTRPPWRKTLPWLGIAAGLVGFNIVTSFADYHQISKGILHMQWFSFGSTVALLGLQVAQPDVFTYPKLLLMGGLLWAAVIGICAVRRPRLQVKPEWERELWAFRLGASIFVGTFVLGTNYDYRTMLLVFCLPFLFLLIRERTVARTWSILTLTLIVIYVSWRAVFPDVYGACFFFKQAIAWGILGGLAGLLVAIFPWPKSSESPVEKS